MLLIKLYYTYYYFNICDICIGSFEFYHNMRGIIKPELSDEDRDAIE
jgi:hypothetical protein